MMISDTTRIAFRRFLKTNMLRIINDISQETGQDQKTVVDIIDSLHCYILYTSKAKDECLRSQWKKANKNPKRNN